ncbi:TenA family transcriptional regulator [Parahaliea aestuarii]|uniref:Iron-containing redox enzyme family protein n=1 Tax=Parahaliea aestuarii TaxID=1852021 RepID=A0A5C9A1B0_9GAMM|nr:iron-containing redox enzyme family protein [Parahaliea aestuarii]TXS94548.1 iron-containing redox enzyme family protein [Parahaliea aestuarii]
MSFYQHLLDTTTAGREALQGTSLVRDALEGRLTRERYAAFLCQAFHHVRHTVPLLMATGSRLRPDQEWLRVAIAEYIDEETGHQEWVLNDIAACGYDRDLAEHSAPNAATELMVAYAYHLIDRGNPLGFFGMVHVLEGTSIAVADAAASSIMVSTGLPPAAFTYLRSHGALDIDHVDFFRGLMDRIESPQDQQVILHAANMFYRLYADVFRSVESEQAAALAA